MTNTPANDQRDALRARIEAAERRNAEKGLAEQARAAADAAIDYTRANPLTVIGGAVAFGLVIGLLTRPGRRVAGRALHSAGDAISGAASSATSGVKSITARGGSRLGQMIGEAAVAYAMTVIDDLLDAARHLRVAVSRHAADEAVVQQRPVPAPRRGPRHLRGLQRLAQLAVQRLDRRVQRDGGHGVLLVLLHARLAAEGFGDDGRGIVVAVAGQILNGDVRVGEGLGQMGAKIIDGHGHGKALQKRRAVEPDPRM